MKLAYADVKAYDGDPRFGPIPVKEIAVQGVRRKARCAYQPG